MRGAILITDVYPETFVSALEVRGLPLIYLPHAGPEALQQAVPQAEIWIVRTRTRVTEALVRAAPQLRLVIRTGSGIDNINAEALAQRGIALHTTPEGNRDAVGEHATGLLLALFRRTLPADRALRGLTWMREANRGIEIMGKTIGIIGYGHTGGAVARRLSGYGAQVLAYDKYKTDYGDAYATAAPLETLFAEADVLTLHVPLAADTRYMVDTPFLAQFRKPIWLLNLSRGEVVQTSAVLDALVRGRVLGAGLDVFENERLETLNEQQRYELYALAQMDNVILTPHLGGVTHEAEARLNQLTLDAVLQYLAASYGRATS